MSTPFRFVVVGSGNMASTYAQILEKLPQTELAATVSRSGKRPASVSEKYELSPSLAEVASPFDGVILATPNGLHHQGAIEAARLGKHVLTEKVLDVTREAMEAMIKTCREENVKLGVAFQRRTSPDNQALKKLLESNRLGRVFAADLIVKFYRDQAYYDSAAYRGDRCLDGGGPFMQQAAHNLDVYTWLFGMPSKVVSNLGTFCHQMESEDHGAALLKYDNGMIGSVIASTACQPGFSARLEVHSEEGTAILENDCITVWKMGDVPNPSQGATEIHDGATSASVSETLGHELIIADFVNAVREDRDPMIPGEDARWATDLVLEIYSNQI